MRRTILIPLIAMMAMVSSAADWSMSLYYDFTQNKPSLVATKKIGNATDFLGTGTDLELRGFVGSTLDNGSPVAGVTLGKSFHVAKEVDGWLGLGTNWKSGEPIENILKNMGFGVSAGVTWRF